MKQADQRAMENGTSGSLLMGRASRALAAELNFYADGDARSVVIVAGPGNNGGDGFGLAVHLQRLGWFVQLWIAADRERIKGDARDYLERAEASGVPHIWKTETSDWEHAGVDLPPGAWVVDALLGTGVQDAPRSTPAAAVSFLRRIREDHRIWAIDIPTGLNPDTGNPFDAACCVRADSTLSLAGPKRGCAEDHAAEWTGSVSVLDIGIETSEDIPEELADGEWQVLTDREIRHALPAHTVREHKGTRGHGLFIGGSPGMSGSISMSAFAALRSGAGLSTVLAPFTTAPSIDASIQELMVLPGKQSKFMTLSPQPVPFDLFQAICIGPGLRVNQDTVELLRRVVHECPLPLVIDADGLSCLSKIGLKIGHGKRPVFLTPHPGEMGRLLNRSSREVQKDRCSAVCEAWKQTKGHVVLKGSRSRIVTMDGGRWVNCSGNEALATGGTGDVLAGILTGLIARGVPMNLVLPVSVALHGRAGELASIRNGISSVVAGDVLEALPAVFQHAEGR